MRGTEQAEILAKNAAYRFRSARGRYDAMMVRTGNMNDPDRLESHGHQVQAWGLEELAEAVALLAVAIRQTYDQGNRRR